MLQRERQKIKELGFDFLITFGLDVKRSFLKAS
jgi:hypothetical protein